jgi:hypothetical protein
MDPAGALISDATLVISLVSAIGMCATAIIGVVNAVKLTRTSANIQKIETATNSMKDALVAATAKGSHAEGVVQGRAEVTAEKKAADETLNHIPNRPVT